MTADRNTSVEDAPLGSYDNPVAVKGEHWEDAKTIVSVVSDAVIGGIADTIRARKRKIVSFIGEVGAAVGAEIDRGLPVSPGDSASDQVHHADLPADNRAGGSR